eukprot:348640-Rhodomonas_salina.1
MFFCLSLFRVPSSPPLPRLLCLCLWPPFLSRIRLLCVNLGPIRVNLAHIRVNFALRGSRGAGWSWVSPSSCTSLRSNPTSIAFPQLLVQTVPRPWHLHLISPSPAARAMGLHVRWEW